MRTSFRGLCAVCGEPIDRDETYYEMPYDELVHEDCGFEWLEKRLHYGEEDMGWDDAD